MSERRVRLDLDVVLLAYRDELFVLAEGVDFDLVDARDYFGMLEKALEVFCAEVGHSDGLDDGVMFPLTPRSWGLDTL
jgi:hypothetical protein